MTEKQIIEQVYQRFIPGENEKDAKFHIVKKLDENPISYRFKDFCHYHSQRGTFTGVVDTFKYTISNMWHSINKKKSPTSK